jgi:hypothetical protein
MNWTEGPATWKQLRYLSQNGYKPERPLTKTEAAELIRSLGGQPETFTITNVAVASEEKQEIGPYQLRQGVESAQRTLNCAGPENRKSCQEAYDSAVSRRQQFWADTCREVSQMRGGSKACLELYRKHGCLLNTPTPFQVQQVLDALDSAMPVWDKEHPELFFETLSLNFPELARRR